MSHSESEVDPLVDLAQDFADRYRRGEHPSLSEYAARFPEHAERIRQIFPAMMAIECLGPSSESGAGSSRRALRGLERLGDYRILREIARGGMGVVYDAVQESLGRRVALKVLPLNRLVSPSQMERFRLEARAAARLHHSNIVPVFGVGECDGVHYYAMQYIAGQSLDLVLEEVRRLRGLPLAHDRGATRHALAQSHCLAQSLISGRLSDAGRQLEETSQNGVLLIASSPGPETAVNPTAVAPPATEAQSELANQSEFQYARSVARIGLQVAQALAYAHQQGILHRDIKPSNILLDTQGTAWVTDFGLAKADDSGELTGQGDIVGTLRYMAPERFLGRADRRSDVYGLGLTIYEMLTLRAAFEYSDRARVVEKVLHEEPPRPRRVDSQVPRDLETIVLKAIAKEPARRYASCQALAEDLERFLADRPIAARQTPIWERTWRFCRRNPALSASIAAVAALIVSIAAFWADWTARLDVELRRTGDARRAEGDAKKDALEKLWRSNMARAQAGRFSRRPGQRLDSLDALRDAVSIARTVGAPESSFHELRDEAVACLALTDIRPAKTAVQRISGSPSFVFDAGFQKYALATTDGAIIYRRGAALPIGTISGLSAAPEKLWISPDGCYLAIATAEFLHIREIEGARLVASQSGKPLMLEWSADSKRVAIGHADGTLTMNEAATGRELSRLRTGFAPALFALHPDGRQIAIAEPERGVSVEIHQLDPPKKVTALALGESGPAAIAWSPDGRKLAISLSETSVVEIWDVAERRPFVSLAGHAQRVYGLNFGIDGKLLLSQSWDGTGRLWDVATGRQLVCWPSYIADPHFSKDGNECGYVIINGEVRLLEVAEGREYRTLVADIHADRAAHFRADLSDDDILALTTADGVHLLSLASDRELAFLPCGFTSSVQFMRGKNGRELLTCDPLGFERWPIHEKKDAGGVVSIGRPRAVSLPAEPSVVTVAPDGHNAIVACEESGVAILLDLDEEATGRRILSHPEVSQGSLSADGRWAATWGWHTPQVKIWDARTGALEKELAIGHQNAAFFSTDSRTLVTSLGREYRFWEILSWKPFRELHWEIPSYPGWVAFSPDGRLMALELSPAVVHLLDAATGEKLAKLEDPGADRARWLRFTADGGRLIAIAPYSAAIHVWDLRRIAGELESIGLSGRFTPASLYAGPRVLAPQSVEVVDASRSAAHVRELKAKNDIDRFNRAHAADPRNAIECNSLAWALLSAPAHLRDPARALAMAQEADRLKPGEPAYRNTLGVAYFRAGRYREAIEILRADLESQEDQYLAWDLCFLAMSFHRLGETERAREFQTWALRWSRDQKYLSAVHRLELLALRDEMAATLKN